MKNENGRKKSSNRVQFAFRFWNLILIISLFGVLIYLLIKDQEKGDTNDLQTKVITIDTTKTLDAEGDLSKDEDDLTAISGIGKKVSMLLTAHGIYTYRQLADAERQDLVRLLQKNNLRFMDPHDWQIQAAELADK